MMASGLGAMLLANGNALAAATPGLVLLETPRDGDAAVLTAVREARQTVEVVVYEFNDEDLLVALGEQQAAGRKVRVILNAHFADGDDNKNAVTGELLEQAGIPVHWSNPAFTYTHEKAIIVDAGLPTQKVLIMTLNLQPGYMGKVGPRDRLPVAPVAVKDFAPAPGVGWGQTQQPPVLQVMPAWMLEGWDPAFGPGPVPVYMSNTLPYSQSLNFAVIDRDPTDVAQLEKIFNADWKDQTVETVAAGDLVVSPINAREKLMGEIQQAKRSIHIFAQEFFDAQVVQAVLAAARRGVEVKALLAPGMPRNLRSASRLAQAGGEARILDMPYEHAKATIVDGEVVYIGSINYTQTSLEKNREAGILTRQADIVAQMEAEFARFWKQGTPPAAQ